MKIPKMYSLFLLSFITLIINKIDILKILACFGHFWTFQSVKILSGLSYVKINFQIRL